MAVRGEDLSRYFAPLRSAPPWSCAMAPDKRTIFMASALRGRPERVDRGRPRRRVPFEKCAAASYVIFAHTWPTRKTYSINYRFNRWSITRICIIFFDPSHYKPPPVKQKTSGELHRSATYWVSCRHGPISLNLNSVIDRFTKTEKSSDFVFF